MQPGYGNGGRTELRSLTHGPSPPALTFCSPHAIRCIPQTVASSNLRTWSVRRKFQPWATSTLSCTCTLYIMPHACTSAKTDLKRPLVRQENTPYAVLHRGQPSKVFCRGCAANLRSKSMTFCGGFWPSPEQHCWLSSGDCICRTGAATKGSGPPSPIPRASCRAHSSPSRQWTSSARSLAACRLSCVTICLCTVRAAGASASLAATPDLLRAGYVLESCPCFVSPVGDSCSSRWDQWDSLTTRPLVTAHHAAILFICARILHQSRDGVPNSSAFFLQQQRSASHDYHWSAHQF